jgi:hypothetical protein
MCLIGFVDPALCARIEVHADRSFVIGIDRHTLQAQFPPSTIELLGCHQLGSPSLYGASITAAATDPTATPTLALMPKTRRKHSSLGFQKSVCLHAISQALKDRHFRKFEICLPILGGSTCDHCCVIDVL